MRMSRIDPCGICLAPQRLEKNNIRRIGQKKHNWNILTASWGPCCSSCCMCPCSLPLALCNLSLDGKELPTMVSVFSSQCRNRCKETCQYQRAGEFSTTDDAHIYILIYSFDIYIYTHVLLFQDVNGLIFLRCSTGLQVLNLWICIPRLILISPNEAGPKMWTWWSLVATAKTFVAPLVVATYCTTKKTVAIPSGNLYNPFSKRNPEFFLWFWTRMLWFFQPNIHSCCW